MLQVELKGNRSSRLPHCIRRKLPWGMLILLISLSLVLLLNKTTPRTADASYLQNHSSNMHERTVDVSPGDTEMDSTSLKQRQYLITPTAPQTGESGLLQRQEPLSSGQADNEPILATHQHANNTMSVVKQVALEPIERKSAMKDSVESVSTVKEVAESERGEQQGQATDAVANTNRSPRILIVITTNRSLLNVRAKAIIQSWARNLPGNVSVIFFVGRRRTDETIKDIEAFVKERGLVNSSSFVVLDVADNEYPPVYKNTAMLVKTDRIVQETRKSGNNPIEWIFKVDDDTFVNPETLTAFVESKDPSQNHFYGSQGMARPADRDELKKAGLEKPFCQGGPGYILSHSALHASTSSFGTCVAGFNASPGRRQVWHSDTIISMCVYQKTRLGCWDDRPPKSTQAKHLFRHISKNSSHLHDMILKHDREEALLSISMHPVKKADDMTAIHALIVSN